MLLFFALSMMCSRLTTTARKRGHKSWPWCAMLIGGYVLFWLLGSVVVSVLGNTSHGASFGGGLVVLGITFILMFVLDAILRSLAPGPYLSKPLTLKLEGPEVSFICTHCKVTTKAFATQRGHVTTCKACSKPAMVPRDAPTTQPLPTPAN